LLQILFFQPSNSVFFRSYDLYMSKEQKKWNFSCVTEVQVSQTLWTVSLKYFYWENLALSEYGVPKIQSGFCGAEFSTCFGLLTLSFFFCSLKKKKVRSETPNRFPIFYYMKPLEAFPRRVSEPQKPGARHLYQFKQW
jgi:hypothetical protein